MRALPLWDAAEGSTAVACVRESTIATGPHPAFRTRHALLPPPFPSSLPRPGLSSYRPVDAYKTVTNHNAMRFALAAFLAVAALALAGLDAPLRAQQPQVARVVVG